MEVVRRTGVKKMLKKLTGSILTIMLMTTMFLGAFGVAAPEPVHAAGGGITVTANYGGVTYTIVTDASINDEITFATLKSKINAGTMSNQKSIYDVDGSALTKKDHTTLKIASTGTGSIVFSEENPPKKSAISVSFQVTQSHTHSWSYSASDRVITAKCNGSGTCPVGNQTVTLGAVSNKTYDGSAQTAPTASKSNGWTSGNGLASVGSVTVSPTNSANAGTYTASVSAGEKTATSSWTISRANINPTVSINGWTYGSPNSPSVSGNTGSGEVTYTYYTDSDCTTKTTTANGAPSTGGRPLYAGTYYVKASIAQTTNYNGATTAAKSFTINKRQVTVSGIKAQNKTYDGKIAADLDYSDVSFDNIVTGDNLSVTATGNFDNKNAGTNKTVSLTNLTLGGSSAANYELKSTGQQSEAKADITQLTAQLKWTDTSLTYNGKAQKPTATITNLQENDEGVKDTCLVTVTGEQTDAGMYTATASDLTGADKGNYKLPDDVTQAFVIAKADAELEVSIKDWTYGESPSTPIVDGAPEGTTVTIEYKPTGAGNKAYTTAVPTEAGNYNIRAKVTASPNYNVTSAVDVFTINKRELGLKWPQEDSEGNIKFTYNGEDQCPIAMATGLLDEDSCEVTVTGADASAGTHIATASALSNSNYKLPKAATHKYIIEKADIKPVVTLENWTYGDKASSPSVEGNTGGGNVSYLYKVKGAGDGTYSDTRPTDAGEYTVKAVVSATTNYNAGSDTCDFEIDKRTAELEWKNVIFEFDGESHVPTATITTLVKGDDCGVKVTGAATAAGKHTATASELTGADKDNYQLPGTTTQDFTITKGGIAPVVTITGWTYAGTSEEPVNAPNVEGNKGGGEVTYTYAKKGSDDFGSYADKVNGQAGSYTVKASIAAAGGYDETECTEDFTIEQKTASIAWSNLSFVYNAEVQCPTATVSNLVGTDSCSVTVTGGRTNAGDYSAKATALSNANYKLPDTVNHTFRITKADLKVKADNKKIDLGAAPPEYTVTYDGFKGNDDKSVLGGTLAIECSYTEGGHAGIYDIVPSGLTSANYSISFEKGTLTVGTMVAVITKDPSANELTYAADDRELVTEGTASHGKIYYRVNGGAWSDKVPKGKNANEYTVSWYLKPDPNYTSESSADNPAGQVTVKIKKAELKVTADDKDIAMDAPAPEYTVKYAGFKGGETEADLSGTLRIECDYKPGDPQGEYAIVPSGYTSDNYNINFVNGKLSVGAGEAVITASPEANTLIYSASDQELVTAGTASHGTLYYRIGAGTWSDQLPKAKNAGTYKVSWYLEPKPGYTSESSPSKPAGSVDVTVGKATLTVTAENKTCNIDADPPEYTAKYSGFVGDPAETVDVLGGELKFACRYKKGDVEGVYDIVPSGYTSDNYNFRYVNGKLTVGNSGTADVEAPVPADLTYNGDDQTLVTISEASHGTAFYRVGGGKWSTAAPEAKDAGKYTVSWYVKPDDGYMSASSASEPAGSVEVTIRKKAVTLDWVAEEGSEETKLEYTFDGNDHLPFAKLSGVFEGDDLSADVSGAASSVGTHKAKASISGDSEGNYKLPSNSTAEFRIVKAAIQPTVTMAGWTYGDKASVPVVNGNPGGGNVTYVYKKKGAEDTGYVDERPTDVGEYTVRADIAAASGYEAGYATADFSISPRTVQISWSDLAFEYDGESHVPTATVTNLVKGDSVDVTVSGEQTKAGTDHLATAEALTGDDAGNYALPDPKPTQTFTITKGTLTPAVTLTGWTYGEEANTPSVEGNLGGGDVTYTYAEEGSADFSENMPTDAGTYIVKASIAETDDGYLAAEATSVFTISPRTASIGWTDTSLTYNKKSQIPKAEVLNLVGSDSCSVDVEGAKTNAGEYVATATGLSNDNYRLPEGVNQTFIIAKANMDYDVKDYTAVRDNKYHGITVKVSDPSNAVVRYGKTKGACSLDKSPTYKNEGSYDVYYQVTADNYNTVTGKAKVVIMAKPVRSYGPDVITDSGNKKFAPLKPRSARQTQNSITLNWNAVSGAARYVVYGNKCDSNEHAYYLKKLGTTSGKSFKALHLDGTKLQKGTMHKFMIVAFNEDDKEICRSSVIHVVTKGSKWRNYTGVKISAPKKSRVTLKVGKKAKIKAAATGRNVRKHAGIRYESSNKSVAVVSKSGTIKGVRRGKCVIYVYTQNGKYKTVKVTVK